MSSYLSIVLQSCSLLMLSLRSTECVSSSSSFAAAAAAATSASRHQLVWGARRSSSLPPAQTTRAAFAHSPSSARSSNRRRVREPAHAQQIEVVESSFSSSSSSARVGVSASSFDDEDAGGEEECRTTAYGWVKPSSKPPELRRIKARRDRERLRARREREVARVIGGGGTGLASWGAGRYVIDGGGSNNLGRSAVAMTVGGEEDGPSSLGGSSYKQGDSSWGHGQQRRPGGRGRDANASTSRRENGRRDRSREQYRGDDSSRRMNRQRQHHNKRQGRRPFPPPSDFLAPFQDVEKVDELDRMVDKILQGGDEDDGSSPPLINPREATNLIRLLGARGAYSAMLRFLRHPRSQPSVFSYTAAIASLAQSSNPAQRYRSVDLLNEMDNLGIDPNTYTFTALMLAMDGGTEASKMMERARQYGEAVERNVYLFNSAIHACSRYPSSKPANGGERYNDGWQTALLFFRQMKKEGVQPNEQTYASLLHACGKSGQVKLALFLLDEMKNNPNVGAPNAKVWGSALQVMATAGDFKEAMKMMREMVEVYGVRANTLHYNAVLGALAKMGQDKIALGVLASMQNGTAPLSIFPNGTTDASLAGSSCPDLVSLNTVLAACAKNQNYRDARILLAGMKEGKYQRGRETIRPDIISYNTVLSSCRNPADAEALVEEMRLSRRDRYHFVKPTSVTFTNAISVCRKFDPPDLERAMSLLNTAIRDGIKPNVYMYSAAIWTAERCGNYEAALSILESMKSAAPARRCKPNVVSYDGVISAFASHGRFKDAIRLFEEMLDVGISPTPISYQRLVVAINKATLTEKEKPPILEPIVQNMQKKDRRAKVGGPVLAALIRSYGSIGNYDEAKEVFEFIEGPADAACLSAMLYACAKAVPARWEDAVLFLHSSDIVVGACGPGKIESMALTYAVIACSKENKWEEALNLIELYGLPSTSRGDDDLGGKPVTSVNAINALISACGRSGRADIAVNLLNDMTKTYHVVPNLASYRSAIIACNQAEHERNRQARKSVETTWLDTSSSDGDENSPVFHWWEVALSLLRRMNEAEIQPDVQTYSSVISSCEAAGEWQRALGILRSMTRNATETAPNLYCFNAAIAACEKGGAWLEAVELYERIKNSSLGIKPNFITINSLILALDKAGQRDMADNIFREAAQDGIFSPWKTRLLKSGKRIRAMDLHQFSAPMAKISVRTALESLLDSQPEHDINNDFIIIVGKGKQSEDGTPVLMPVVNSLLEELGVPSTVDEENTGRILVNREALGSYVERMAWRDR